MLTDDVTSSYLKRCSLMARLSFMKAIYFFKIMYNSKERRDEKRIYILLKLSYKLIAEY